MSSKMTIIEGNSNDKDNVRAYMVKGEPGNDGVSPTIDVERTNNKVTVSTVDAEGTHEADIYDGVSPTVTTSKEDGVTTVTITDINGTRTAEIVDGIDLTGGVPTAGVIGFDGVAADIPDGYEVSTLIPQALNQYSNSTADTYSANYINSKFAITNVTSQVSITFQGGSISASDIGSIAAQNFYKVSPHIYVGNVVFTNVTPHYTNDQMQILFKVSGIGTIIRGIGSGGNYDRQFASIFDDANNNIYAYIQKGANAPATTTFNATYRCIFITQED